MKSDNGKELAKVLWYYGVIPNISIAIQKIVCPFHDDVNPSMIIDLQAGRWHCFGCNKSGDAKKFVYEVENKYGGGINDLQAYQILLNILKTDKVSDIKLPQSVRRFKRKHKRELYNLAYDEYHGLSHIDWINDDSKDVLESKVYMNKRGFDSCTLVSCGAKITYENNYPIIFPLFDNNKFKGWVKRTTNKQIEKKRKYLYNEGFSRATTLVGEYGSKDYIIIVEGYMDRLKFIQNGVINVVAILGWKITDEQIAKLKSVGIKNVISALDNDDCGKKGTAYLKTIFNVTRFCYIKGIKDPGEMDKNIFNKCFRKTMKKFKQERNVDYE